MNEPMDAAGIAEKLTPGRRAVLEFLARHPESRDAVTAWISRRLNHRSEDWAGSHLRWLRTVGAACYTGQAFGEGKVHAITPLGELALKIADRMDRDR